MNERPRTFTIRSREYASNEVINVYRDQRQPRNLLYFRYVV